MNIKSLLLASVVATVAGSAFANNFDFAEVQVAQLNAPTVRSAARAPSTEAVYTARNDATPFVSGSSDMKSRADVRAETINYLKSGEARAARSVYVGGAQ